MFFSFLLYLVSTFFFDTGLYLAIALAFCTALMGYTYLAELIKGNLSIEVSVSLDDSTVDELLELHVVQVVANHHLQHLEQFAVRDEPVVVHVVDLECETQLLLLRSASRQGVQSLDKLQERDVSVLVLVQYSNDSLHQRVLSQLRDVKEFLGLKGATLIFIDLREVLVKLLQLSLRDYGMQQQTKNINMFSSLFSLLWNSVCAESRKTLWCDTYSSSS